MGFLSRIFSKKEQRGVEGNYIVGQGKDPPIWLTGGATTKSGISINESNAEQLSALYAGVTIICSTVGKLKLPIYERKGEGKERATKHPIYTTFQKRPNSFMTAIEFKELICYHLLLWGNFYAQILERQDGSIELNPLFPNKMKVWQNADLTLGYGYDYKNKPLILDQREVFHVKGLRSDGIKGKSVIQAAREGIGRAQAGDQYAADFYKNMGVPLGILQHPGALGDEAFERIKQDWQQKHATPGARHGIALLEEGMTFTQMALTNEDAQLLETRKFEVTEIARWLNCPPHKLKDMEHATFSNIEHQNMEFYQDTIEPWCSRIADAINFTFFSEGSEKRYFAEFLFDSLLITDTKTRYEAHNLALVGGWKTPNEIRVIENMNKLDGLDKPFRPLNMGEPGTDKKDPAPEAPKPEPDPKPEAKFSNLQPIFRHAFERAFRRESLEYSKRFKQSGGLKQMTEFYPKLEEQLSEDLSPIMESLSQQLSEKSAVNFKAEAISDYIQRAQTRLIEAMQQNSPQIVDNFEQFSAGIIEKLNFAEVQNAK